MRLIKMLGLAAVAAMAAMAFVGATSASANGSTQLCNTHDAATALTCDSAATGVRMIDDPDTTDHLLTNILDVLCDHVEGLGTPLALANPQQLHITGLLFGECETNEGDICIVTVLTQPLSNLLKTGLDLGTLTATNGSTLVDCEDVFFGVDLHCVYDATGLQFTVGAQHLTANETQIDETGNLSLCPDESFLDGLLETATHGGSKNRYVLA